MERFGAMGSEIGHREIAAAGSAKMSAEFLVRHGREFRMED
jgi:hypothetical protein